MKPTKRTSIFSLIFIFLYLSTPFQTLRAQTQFLPFIIGITLPEGITVDAQGRALVHSETFMTTEAIQYDANGLILNQITFGHSVFEKVPFIGSRLSYDAYLNRIIMLTPEGSLYLINLQTADPIHGLIDVLQVSPEVISILPETIVASAVFDISTGQIAPFVFPVDTVLHYGDVALFRPVLYPDQLSVIVTGTVESLVEPSVPFVMEIAIGPVLGTPTPKLTLISSATSITPPLTLDNRTRGVAVNHHGIGLTTLPIADVMNPGETKEVAVTFPVYTPTLPVVPPAPVLPSVPAVPADTPSLSQPAILFNGLDVPSSGMTSDQAGHFYIASGDEGSSFCGLTRSGALIVIPVDINGIPLTLIPLVGVLPADPMPLGIPYHIACFPIATTPDEIVSSRDIAINPVDQSVLVTVNNTDLVLEISQPQ